MRQLSINRLKQGDVLGRTIYTNDGRVLLGRGIALTPSFIKRLSKLGITIVYVDDEETKDVVIEDVISEEHRREAMSSLEYSGQAVQLGKDFDGFKVKKAVNNIIEDILFQKEIFISLTDMRSYDNQVFAHSVSVCVLATVLGKALGLDQNNLEALAIGALFHDIGTVKLPKTLLSKREVFTPKEARLYETHTSEGFDILRSKRELNLLSAHIAFQHHERMDGSGYPRKLESDGIHQLAQIVGIADFYDNLVNDGPGHSRILPHVACEILMGCSDKLFSHDLVVTFLKHIAAYPTGCTVKLNTGEIGIVVDQNKSLPMRPIVRVLLAGQDLNQVKAKEYDLVKERTTFIEAMLE
ncbi:HD-GYP domain-containing protein [Desulfitobacterium sp.]|uniref:HD-GYP domain-containing protein n=1 Tax=Desulfitobacterium sp. TaxID=49981 RepID=UPI002B7A2F08|nr:HD domain-containing phosphohydrolase [Desulfitobacterium sp.]HVJ49943.1 HD domain-containing phosphohydrolase [Desulfitobacterium sp.]